MQKLYAAVLIKKSMFNALEARMSDNSFFSDFFLSICQNRTTDKID